MMEKAFNALEFLSHDEQTRQRYEARQKALRDYATAIETAEQSGELKGEHRKAVIVAQRLLMQGMSTSDTAQLTDLLVSEVARGSSRPDLQSLTSPSDFGGALVLRQSAPVRPPTLMPVAPVTIL